MFFRRTRLAALAILLLEAPTQAADITFEIKGAASAKGDILIAFFDSPATFLGKPAQGIKIPATTTPAVAVLHDVKPGMYAVSAFHDENANGTLDKNLLGLPIEKYGFSRDAAGRMSTPSFEAASFAVGADNQTIVINLH
jgi:uncharacterized protein (DUF2141 family)